MTYPERLKELKNCKNAIDEGIAKGFDGCTLRYNLAEAIKAYGLKAVQQVIAVSIREHDYDGRFSKDNIEWAKGVDLSEHGSAGRYEMELKAHRCLINALANEVRGWHE